MVDNNPEMKPILAKLQWLARHQGKTGRELDVLDDLIEHEIAKAEPTDEVVDLLVSDVHGIHMPEILTERTSFEDWHGIDRDDWDVIANGAPMEEEFYWDSYNRILDSAIYVGDVPEWVGCRLYQSGDLFLVPPNFDYEVFEGV